MLVEGDKRKGRYLKKGTAVFDIVKVQPFSFADICKKELIYRDNPLQNIIHHRLHEVSEIDQCVKESSIVREQLIDKDNMPPIMKPRDFTEDWIEQKKRARRRGVNTEDEEYDFMEEQLQEEEEEARSRRAERAARRAEVRSEARAVSEQRERDLAAQAQQRDVTASQAKAEASVLADSESKLKELQSPQLQNSGAIEIVDEAIKKMKGPGVQSPPVQAEAKTSEPAPKPLMSEPVISTADDGTSAPDASSAAKPESRETGFQAGFDEGLAKADTIAESLAKLSNELGKLKKDVLSSAQDNFNQLAKAMCEALLEREIKTNPVAMASLIKKAIDSSLKEDKFTIRVHPDMYERLAALESFTLKDKLIKDTTVGPQNFKIESDLSVIDSGVKDVVAKLLDQVDLDLFGEKE